MPVYSLITPNFLNFTEPSPDKLKTISKDHAIHSSLISSVSVFRQSVYTRWTYGVGIINLTTLYSLIILFIFSLLAFSPPNRYILVNNLLNSSNFSVPYFPRCDDLRSSLHL